MNEHYQERAVLSRLQERHSSIFGRTTYFGPAWIPAGLRPIWLQRIIAIDISGRMYGPIQPETPYDAPVDFSDSDLEELIADLRLLPNLQELQLGFTAVSSASVANFQKLPKLSFVNAQGSRIRTNSLLTRAGGPDIKIYVRSPKNTKFPIGYGSP